MWQKQKGYRLFREQIGLTLLEVIIAVAILAVIGVVFMQAMSVAYKNVGITDERQQAESLARSQIELIKSANYSDSGVYPITVALPPQYSMNITTTSPGQVSVTGNNYTSLNTLVGYNVTTIQEITVYVYHGNRNVLSIACYKVK
jgi:prepilin-type N-terminal cleavage/methylation domain-containing protein